MYDTLATILPGMPITLPKGKDVVLGKGLYRAEDGTVRASLTGKLEFFVFPRPIYNLNSEDYDFESKNITTSKMEISGGGPELSLHQQSSDIRETILGHIIQSERQGSAIPSVGQIIVGRVVRLTSRYASVEICVIEGQKKTFSGTQDNRNIWLQDPFKATLRSTDIWPSDIKDAPALISQAVRPGDLIRACIISVGDASTGFLISIARCVVISDQTNSPTVQSIESEDPHLGVIYALCESSGNPLQPISWNQMRCPVTGICELRKPAKPQQV